MRLRGALSPSFNVILGIIMVAQAFLAIYAGYGFEAGTRRNALVDMLSGLPLGILTGLPACIMNLRAVDDLRAALDNKFFLSSQLALLDSRHGKNAIAYFYIVVYSTYIASRSVPSLRLSAATAFAEGLYFSANVLPFLLAATRRTRKVRQEPSGRPIDAV